MREILIILLFSSVSVLASLQETSSSTSAVSSAMGGAGIASVSAGDISSLNPAGLVFLYGYNFYSRYMPGETAIGISDNTRDSVIPAALYIYQKQDYKNFKLSFAEPFSKRVTLGFNLSYYQNKIDYQNKNLASADLGLTYLLRTNMALGVVVYDLNQSPKDWPLENRIESKLGVGYHYVYRGFLRARADYLSGNKYNFQEGSWRFGLEDYLSRWTIIRIGYQENTTNISDLITIGFGFDLPKFKINYAYLTESQDGSQMRHSIDLTVPF